MPAQNNHTGYTAYLPLIVAVGSVLLAWQMSLAPRPVPASAPPEVFSAERAFVHIALNCTEPHPAGSVHNDRVYQYLLDELQRLELEIEQVDYYAKIGRRSVEHRRAALGRIRGHDNTGAFAIDAHFDSVPWGPGAADDFSGVAAMLETARALKAGPPLRNDIIFVFADQEEFNMGGARAFRNHPWFEETAIVLGLETRGNAGPALMFETAPNNGFVVRQAARSGVAIRANSIMYDVYKRMPFNTNFDHYKDAVAGLNVAYIDHFDYYHTMLDTPENVSLASLQHHGDYALGLARHFGDMELGDCYAPDVAYFNTLGSHLVVYSMAWNQRITFAALALFGGVVVYGLVRRSIGPCKMASAFLAITINLAIAAIVTWAMCSVIYSRFREAALYQNNTYALAFTMMSISGFVLLLAFARKRIGLTDFLAGGLIWWAICLVTLHIYIPGGTNTATWPLVFGTVCLLVLVRCSGPQKPTIGVAGLLIMFALPPLILLSPLLIITFQAVTILGAVVVVPLALMLCVLVAPALYVLQRTALLRIAAVLFGAGLVVLVLACLGTRPSPRSPKLNTLAYAVDFDLGKAFWVTRRPDEWTSLYIDPDAPAVTLTEFLPGDHSVYYTGAAPMPPFEQTTLEVIDDRTRNGRRILDCRLNSTRDAQRLWLQVTSPTAVYSASVLGHELDGAEHGWGAYFALLPRDGARLRLEVEAGVPLVFSIREESHALPAFDDFTPRPDDMIPEPNRRLNRYSSLHSEFTYSLARVDLGKGDD